MNKKDYIPLLVKIAFLFIVVLTVFYFAFIQGTFDNIVLKEVNKRLPFVLKWGGRTFLNFHGIEIETKDNGYFCAPELRASLKLRLNPLGGLIFFEFEEAYANQGKKLTISDISATIPLQFVCPDEFYIYGMGNIKCGQIKIGRTKFLCVRIDIIGGDGKIFIKEFKGEFLKSLVCAKGKIDIQKKYFTLSSYFDKIDMEEVAAAINSGKFGGQGDWRGNFNLSYQGMGLEGKGEFELISSAGKLKTAFLKELIQKMPEGEPRDRILQGVGEDEYFSFSKGNMDLYIKEEDIKVKLVIQGENGLFDFTINLPAKVVERFWRRRSI